MLSHKYKCIFIHIPKNAGQSIETVFLKAMNLTWKTRGALLLRPNNDSRLGPPRLAHLRATQYVECQHIEQIQFERYFKFAFVRNPWDRMVSFYKYIALREGLSFKEFLMGRFKEELWKNSQWFVGPQSGFVCDPEGNLAVDFLGRFETLASDFHRVCARLGLPPCELPHINKSKKQKWRAAFKPRELWRCMKTLFGAETRKGYRHYWDYYDQESYDVVAELYAEDISRFGYEDEVRAGFPYAAK